MLFQRLFILRRNQSANATCWRCKVIGEKSPINIAITIYCSNTEQAEKPNAYSYYYAIVTMKMKLHQLHSTQRKFDEFDCYRRTMLIWYPRTAHHEPLQITFTASVPSIYIKVIQIKQL